MAQAGPLVTQADIRQVVDRIVRHFNPRQVIVFGSYAYGTPTPDSDVDMLVTMDTNLPNPVQAAIIREAVDFPFPVDLLVRSPRQITDRLVLGDSFLKDILSKGMILYEADHD